MPNKWEEHLQQMRLLRRHTTHVNRYKNAAQMQRVLEGVRLEVDPLVEGLGRPRRVACLEWNDPLMGCGHW